MGFSVNQKDRGDRRRRQPDKHHYIVEKEINRATAAAVRVVVSAFEIATVDAPVIDLAIRLGNPDFEDAVQAAAAVGTDAADVVTRDRKGFTVSGLAVLSSANVVRRFPRTVA